LFRTSKRRSNPAARTSPSCITTDTTSYARPGCAGQRRGTGCWVLSPRGSQ
jgi:hypothetical protein